MIIEIFIKVIRKTETYNLQIEGYQEIEVGERVVRGQSKNN